jgi:hypothetical protein
MTVSWNNEYDCNELAARIEQAKNLSADGHVTFNGFEFAQYVSVLYSMLWFIWQAVSKAGEKGTITAKSLLAEINKLTSTYLQKPLVRYVLVTTLSISSRAAIHRIRFQGVTIVFGPHLNKSFRESRNKLKSLAKPNLFVEIPNNYVFVKVILLARSAHEAADEALNSLDIIRGNWNWFYNRIQPSRMSFGKRKPVNKIILGPIHTLHFPNGKLATEAWWYETKRFENLEPYDVTNDIANFYKFLRNVRNNLAKCNYHKRIEDAICLYTRALDEWDWYGAFLKLWSVLEQLTNTDDSYKTTIRRASFVFEDRNFCQQVLRHLKDYRNKFVHEAADNSEIETYIYQLNNFVEQLLSFHLGNKYGFESIEEASEFLDLPSDKKELSSRIKIMKYAQKYLRHV